MNPLDNTLPVLVFTTDGPERSKSPVRSRDASTGSSLDRISLEVRWRPGGIEDERSPERDGILCVERMGIGTDEGRSSSGWNIDFWIAEGL